MKDGIAVPAVLMSQTICASSVAHRAMAGHESQRKVPSGAFPPNSNENVQFAIV